MWLCTTKFARRPDRYECLAVNDVDTADVENFVMLLNKIGVVFARLFFIVFDVDALIVTDVCPISVVSAVLCLRRKGFR